MLFASGSDRLTKDGERQVELLTNVLFEKLPPFAYHNIESEKDCRASGIGLEAVLIEGHTDSIAGEEVNWPLSTGRAINTYKFMKELNPKLFELSSCGQAKKSKPNERYKMSNHADEIGTNNYGYPLFSVSGYAYFRAIADNETTEGRKKNRRIDLRFIMAPPSTYYFNGKDIYQ